MGDRDKIDERFWDQALEEATGAKSPPDLKARILAATEGSEARPQLSLLPGGGGRRRKLGIAAAVACAVLGFGLIWDPWGDEGTGGGKGHGAIGLANPQVAHVVAATGTEYGLASDGAVELRSGWLLLESGAVPVRVADSVIENVSGRTLVRAGSSPADDELTPVSAWLQANNVEIEMLKDAKRWVRTAGLAALVLTGSAVIDGRQYLAQEDVVVEEYVVDFLDYMSDEDNGSVFIGSLEDLKKLTEDTNSVSLANKLEKATMEAFAKLPRLHTIEFQDDELEIEDDAMPLFKKLISVRSVTMEDWPQEENNTEAGGIAEAVRALPNAKALVLTGSSDDGLESLRDFKKLESFRVTDAWSYITDRGLGYLSTMPNLHSIYLGEYHGQYSPAGIKTLIDGLSLRKLSLGAIDYDTSCVEDGLLEVLGKETTLTVLNIAEAKEVTDKGLEYLSKLPALESLNLAGCNRITDAGLAHLAKIQTLKHLDLSSCSQITQAGFAQVTKLTGLVSLNLELCWQIKGLSGIGSLSALKSLNVNNCEQLKDTDMALIAGLSNLVHLKLGHSDGITNAGIKTLSGLKGLRTLHMEYLDAITDDCKLHLAGMKSLRRLELDYCFYLTPEGMQKLEDALPDCRFEWSVYGDTLRAANPSRRKLEGK